MWIAAQQCADRLNVWVNEGERVHVTSTPIEVDTDFQTALIELIEPYLRQGAVVPVVSGGVRNGSFAQVPCAVASARQVAIPDPRRALYYSANVPRKTGRLPTGRRSADWGIYVPE